MDFLTVDQILNADDIKIEVLEVPEWGGAVRLRALSAGQRAIVRRMVAENPNAEGIEEMVCVMAIVDESGERMFKKDHIEKLKRKAAAPISRIALRALELSGATDPVKAVEEAKKKSTGSEDSPFD